MSGSWKTLWLSFGQQFLLLLAILRPRPLSSSVPFLFQNLDSPLGRPSRQSFESPLRLPGLRSGFRWRPLGFLRRPHFLTLGSFRYLDLKRPLANLAQTFLPPLTPGLPPLGPRNGPRGSSF